MAIPTGTFKASDVNIELGRAATAKYSASDSAVRSLAGDTSGPYSASQLRGKSAIEYGTASMTHYGPTEMTESYYWQYEKGTYAPTDGIKDFAFRGLRLYKNEAITEFNWVVDYADGSPAEPSDIKSIKLAGGATLYTADATFRINDGYPRTGYFAWPFHFMDINQVMNTYEVPNVVEYALHPVFTTTASNSVAHMGYGFSWRTFNPASFNGNTVKEFSTNDSQGYTELIISGIHTKNFLVNLALSSGESFNSNSAAFSTDSTNNESVWRWNSASNLAYEGGANIELTIGWRPK